MAGESGGREAAGLISKGRREAAPALERWGYLEQSRGLNEERR